MKKMIAVILAWLVMIGVFFLVKSLGTDEAAAAGEDSGRVEASPEQSLRIGVTYESDADHTAIALSQGPYESVSCLGVTNVTIDIDGTERSLEDALLNGYISVDEMITCARQDACQGFCRESAVSENGLTVFTYHYNGFRLRYIYDVYETPDGKQHLLKDFLIYGIGSEPNFRPVDAQTGEFIDYEDWGLQFDISEASPSGVTMTCTQSGGQQMGELVVSYCWLCKLVTDENGEGSMESLIDGSLCTSTIAIARDATTEITIDFSHLYGEISPGNYVLLLIVEDEYNADDVPSLMRNYYDRQNYSVEFTIQ